jgi:hypothetical protein
MNNNCAGGSATKGTIPYEFPYNQGRVADKSLTLNFLNQPVFALYAFGAERWPDVTEGS